MFRAKTITQININSSDNKIRGIKKLIKAMRVYRERQILRGLENHELSDIGISEGDVNIEANRSFWDIDDV